MKSTIIHCDCCGKQIPPTANEIDINYITNNKHTTFRTKDICNICIEEIINKLINSFKYIKDIHIIKDINFQQQELKPKEQ